MYLFVFYWNICFVRVQNDVVIAFENRHGGGLSEDTITTQNLPTAVVIISIRYSFTFIPGTRNCPQRI
jgi:hypothetical protein